MNLQEFFCTRALAEHNITDVSIEIDHIKGLTFVNGIEFGIKYPLDYVRRINDLSKNKIYDYCFIGKFGKIRGNLVERFRSEKSKIEDNRRGRDKNLKYQFDYDYFQTIANTRYSLCPNQGNSEKYNHSYGWTYRLIESVLCMSVPIVFRETPYGFNFIKDIEFLWDDDEHCLGDVEYNDIVNYNYQKGLTYWTFNEKEIEIIQRSC